jgi:ABC-type multidrug transport system fused ATPase/permease subunit
MTFGYFQIAFWLMPAERQARMIRQSLFKSILRQDIGWFDVYKEGGLTNRLTEYNLTFFKSILRDFFIL